MKAVFLIGDSIRFGAPPSSPGYGIFVKEKLAGKAEVMYPGENCRFAQYTLRYVHEWAQDIDRDNVAVVHWNNGLWDVLRILGDEPFTPVEFYVDTLKKVHKRIQTVFPKAKIIFATSTNVIEEMSNPDFTRRNVEIEAYNKAAVDALEPLGVEINDLYAVSERLHSKDYHSDWVHFNSEGSEILAQAVTEKIEKYL